MTITIHRGTQEIGGTLIELGANNSRILLDAGYPLFLNGSPIRGDISRLPPEALLALGVLPPIDGLYSWDTPAINGVLISHAHTDHYGLLKYVHPDIPIYLSPGTKTLIEISQRFRISESYTISARLFEMYTPFVVGEFTVIPYLMDHSAFDAAAFEIKAQGKTILYSGDFRGHGRKPHCLERFTHEATRQAELLLIEGSLVSRGDERIITEDELKDTIIREVSAHPGIALVQASSQNIDRLVSFYKAARDLGRTFVVDVYTANVLHELHALGNRIMYPSYSNLKVFYPRRLTQRLYDDVGQEYAKRFSKYHISRAQVETCQGEILMLARPSMQRDLARCNLSGGTFFYSLWEGYRDSLSQQMFEGWIEAREIRRISLHTSGHASIADIRRVIDRLAPKRIVPIHTMAPDAFLRYSDRVGLQTDGVPFEL